MGECKARSIEWKLVAMVARTEGEIDVCTAIALDLGELQRGDLLPDLEGPSDRIVALGAPKPVRTVEDSGVEMNERVLKPYLKVNYTVYPIKAQAKTWYAYNNKL